MRITILLLAVSVFAPSEKILAESQSSLKAPIPAANQRLLAHQTRFSEAELIRVQENIYVAHGYDMSNIIFIEGPEGLVVMDTGFRVEQADLAIAAMQEITDKPIVAVIYSHGHGDHVGGSAAFKAAAPNAQFIAHQGWQRNINYVSSAVMPIVTLRAFAQLGMVLPAGLHGTVGSGGGPVLRANGTLSYVTPTMTVSDGEWLEFGGLRFQVLYTPGDLDDGLSLWFPENRAVLTGDTVTDSHVHAILSTPRHEPGRNAQAFVDSMTRIESLNAEVLIGGHGDVVEGRAAVRRMTRSDRRSAQFMIDEVTRYIRQNRSGEYVQDQFAYPDWFLQGDDRGDYYHKLSWITRGVYAELMGWFGGEAASLAPVSPDTRAARIVDGFGGIKGAMVRLRSAYKAKDFKWATELANYILAIERQHQEARQLKSWSIKALAYASESANERNYLLTQAMMLDGHISLAVIAKAGAARGLPDTYRSADAMVFLHTLGARLNVEAAKQTDLRFRVILNDRDGRYVVDIDRGVLLTSKEQITDVAFTLNVSHKDLALACEGLVAWQALVESGDLLVQGDKSSFDEFAKLF